MHTSQLFVRLNAGLTLPAVAVAWMFATSAAMGDVPNRPNILVILADDLGYGDLSSYGAMDLQSPHIDRLAEQGLMFENFYANCPVCSPTRAALLTGRYQDLVGVPGVIRTHPENSWGWLNPEALLLPSVLKQAGYHTAIVGKWHLGLEAPNRPTDRGFDHFHGFLGDMMDDYYNHRRHGNNYMRLGTKEITPEGHATDLFSQWAVDYLDSRKDADEPFFLYVAYNAPHTPIQPPDDWLAKVQQREPGLDEKRAALVALIEHMDAGIGTVLEALEQNGQADDTLVIFTSDNGGQLNVGANNGDWRDGKQSVYEGGLRVPMIVRWPGKVTPSSRTGQMGLTMDIYPTALKAAGLLSSQQIEGRSLLPTLLGDEQPELRAYWFWRRREGGERYMGKTIDAVRRDRWKLLQNDPQQPFELYDLQTDPREEHDLAGSRRDIYRELAVVLRKQIQRYGTVPWQAPDATR